MKNILRTAKFLPTWGVNQRIEKQAISSALEENKWNKTATAKQLGMSFRSLRHTFD
jgi:transcriptional regulator with GAF, ATPase, and Fis domain